VNRKNILFLQRQPPGSQAHEAMDAILVAGVFEQRVSVLFRDEGVRQIARQPGSSATGSANPIESLADYGIDELYACERSLEKHGLRSEDLIVPVKTISPQEQSRLIQQQDAVLTD
jgi:tRNA 2-thiouridine synthesizing protein C